MEHLVQHAVAVIRERFWEQLSLDELAQSAMVSKFHFLRMFSKVTGVTPGRFLCAVRLQEAKRLLLDTSLNVADISARVGYSSTGSFTRRFTEAVGLSPTQYRKAQPFRCGAADTARTVARTAAARAAPPASASGAGPAARRCTGSVTGVLRTAGPALESVYVGAFGSPILQGVPASWAETGAPGRFTLAGVPAGAWYVHAVARGRGARQGTDAALLTATVGPVQVAGGAEGRLDVALSPMDWTRPPILSALAGVDPRPAGPPVRPASAPPRLAVV